MTPSRDGAIPLTYTLTLRSSLSAVMHAAFAEDWVRAGGD